MRPAYVFLGVGGYLLYRYANIAQGSSVGIVGDLTSTIQTIGAWAMPSDIPFSCVDPKTKRDYEVDIQYTGRLTGVPPLLLAALIRQESGFDARVINRASGARGLGQFMPVTAKEWFGATWEAGTLDPDRSIPMTARYLMWLYRRHGNWRDSVMAYNWGTGNIASYNLAKKTGKPASLPTETANYVRIIYDNWAASLPT